MFSDRKFNRYLPNLLYNNLCLAKKTDHQSGRERIDALTRKQMKAIAIGLCLVVFFHGRGSSQANNTADQVIEGGKVVVELIKVLTGKKDLEKNPGCKGTYADLCIVNESSGSITAVLQQHTSGEKKEMVILPTMKECCLQISTGIWTYDLRISGTIQSIRKGDLQIEGCQNLIMNIKY